MRIVCIGGGPAGLFFSILMKARGPDAEIAVLERNRADDTFGWGVVFSDQTLGNIAAADPPTYERIAESFVHWDDDRRPLPRARHPGRRPRLRRDRPQAAAAHPARARGGAGRRAALRDRGRRRAPTPTPTCWWSPTAPTARPAEVRRALRHHARAAPQPLHLARHAPALRRLHLRVRGDAARLVPGPRLSVRRRHRHVDRRVPRGDLARGRARHGERRRVDRVLRAAVRALSGRPRG